MNNYKHIIYKLAVLLFITSSCIQTSSSNEKLSFNTKGIINCDSLITYSRSKTKYDSNLFMSKPNNVLESICFLDKHLNEYDKQYILTCDESELYFSLGLKIRNKWVRHGTEEFQKELYQEVKLQHVDYTSSFILRVYKYYLINDKNNNLINYFNVDKNIDTSIISKLMEIDNDIKHNLPCKK